MSTVTATNPAATTPRTASATTGTGTSASASASNSNQTVSINDFMSLLSTEMANQDPLQPMDPTQTMTQLAQFTSLQQTNALEQNQSLAAANSYLGTTVTVPGVGTNVPPVSGTVMGVDSSQVATGGSPQLILSGATSEYPITSVAQVLSSAAAAAAAPSSAGTTTTTSPSTNTSTTPSN